MAKHKPVIDEHNRDVTPLGGNQRVQIDLWAVVYGAGACISQNLPITISALVRFVAGCLTLT